MLTLENGLQVQPVYLCNNRSPHCKNASCKVDANSCKHTLIDSYAKKYESVKLFDEFMKRFKPTVYFDTDATTIIFEEVEEK